MEEYVDSDAVKQSCQRIQRAAKTKLNTIKVPAETDRALRIATEQQHLRDRLEHCLQQIYDYEQQLK